MKKILNLFALLVINTVLIVSAAAQTTEFTYQGFITDNNAPANGSYDIEFRLCLAATGPTVVTHTRSGVNVVNGVFTVILDFQTFPPADLYLELGVRPAGSGAFTTLAPRSKFLSVPLATLSKVAVTATNAERLGSTLASQYVLTNDSRLSDARSPSPGSPSYIQNTSSQQASSNFNISGNGTVGGMLTAGSISATAGFNIGLVRVLTSPGAFNFFAGNGAGQSNTSGSANSLFGVNAGNFNTTGSSNTFVGFEAGRNNTTGASNSFFGRDAGRNGNPGNNNAFFGNDAGQNTTGNDNAFFGKGAGEENTTPSGNAFFGALAGNSNTIGTGNSFFGFESGRLNGDADNNSYFGYEAGETNTDGLNNSFFGFTAGKLTTGSRNSFFGSGTGVATTSAFHNSFFGGNAGAANTTGDDNVFIGMESGLLNTTGSGNTTLGTYADVGTNFNNATAIGFRASVGRSNAIVLGSITGVNDATEMTDVGIGVTNPARRLDVNGIIRVGSTTGTIGCIEDRDGTVIAGVCSSDIRFKKNVTPFSTVLENFSKLRPVNYFWRADEFENEHFGTKQSFGLIAQEVEALFPDLVVTDEKGFKAVNYSKLPIYTIQAVKELKVENDLLRRRLEQQQAQIDELKKLVATIKEAK